jgi:hypothetical protein
VDAQEYEVELESCRGRLAKELGEDDVPDNVWGYVMKLGLSYEAITGGGDESWQALVGKAKAYLKKSREQIESYVQPPGRSDDRGAPDEVALEPPENVTKRAEVLGEILATLCANHYPGVRQFRQEYLGGRLLIDEEARAFLDKRGGPHGTNKAARPSVPALERLLDKHRGRYRTPSEMEVLIKLADKLSKIYPWREGDALWFVLTGYPPPIRPVEVRIAIPLFDTPRPYKPNTAQITVTAHAWVGAEVVERAFRDAQRQVLGGDAYARRDERTLEVVRFVARRMREYGKETWEQRRKAWNETYPDWHYDNFRLFRQVYIRFVEQYVYRTYDDPNYELRERTPYEEYRDGWNDRKTKRKDKRARRLAAGQEMHQ